MSGPERMSLDALRDLISQILPMRTWGFMESVRVDDPYDPFIIYNSEWCRAMFHLEREMFSEHLRVSYGRLHARPDNWKMMWSGEECYCWHHHGDLHLLLHFLDGLSAHEAYDNEIRLSYDKRPRTWHPLVQALHDSTQNTKNEIWTKEQMFGRYLKFHRSIWDRYGLRFFELFDLRRPDLWENYGNFLRPVYEPEEQEFKEKGIHHLPRYQVC